MAFVQHFPADEDTEEYYICSNCEASVDFEAFNRGDISYCKPCGKLLYFWQHTNKFGSVVKRFPRHYELYLEAQQNHQLEDTKKKTINKSVSYIRFHPGVDILPPSYRCSSCTNPIDLGGWNDGSEPECTYCFETLEYLEIKRPNNNTRKVLPLHKRLTKKE